VIDKNQLKLGEKQFLLQETTVMEVLDHPHVIKLIETIEDKNHMYIIMEYAKDGDLFDYIAKKKFLEELEASKIMK